MGERAKTSKPTPQESPQQTRRDTRHPIETPYYDELKDVPHDRDWADGQIIWVGDALHIFKRTSKTDGRTGLILQTTNVTITGITNW